jgi:hypothetical protein
MTLLNDATRLPDAVMVGGAGCTMTLWGLQVSDWAVIGSLVITLLGFLVSVVMKLRHERREVIEHRARIEELQRGAKASLRKRTKAGGAVRR